MKNPKIEITTAEVRQAKVKINERRDTYEIPEYPLDWKHMTADEKHEWVKANGLRISSELIVPEIRVLSVDTDAKPEQMLDIKPSPYSS